MKRKALLAMSLFLAFALVGMVAKSATQDNGPVYSMEGAWAGIVALGTAQFGTLDTFTSDAQRHGVEGTFLCTFAFATKIPTPSGLAACTQSGHGNWVRIDKNTYAFTARRIMYSDTGALVGWGKYWGTITPISDNEYTGTMNAQYYLLDGTPLLPQAIKATLHSNRIPIILE